jgi:hypothetical protein
VGVVLVEHRVGVEAALQPGISERVVNGADARRGADVMNEYVIHYRYELDSNQPRAEYIKAYSADQAVEQFRSERSRDGLVIDWIGLRWSTINREVRQ